MLAQPIGIELQKAMIPIENKVAKKEVVRMGGKHKWFRESAALWLS
jgi:hypothetical protein